MKLLQLLVLTILSTIAVPVHAEVHRGQFEIVWGDGPRGSDIKTVRYT